MAKRTYKKTDKRIRHRCATARAARNRKNAKKETISSLARERGASRWTIRDLRDRACSKAETDRRINAAIKESARKLRQKVSRASKNGRPAVRRIVSARECFCYMQEHASGLKLPESEMPSRATVVRRFGVLVKKSKRVRVRARPPPNQPITPESYKAMLVHRMLYC